MFLLETDEKPTSPAKSSSSNEEGSGGGGQRNNTDYIESVIPGFFDIIIIVKIFHNFQFKHIF